MCREYEVEGLKWKRLCKLGYDSIKEMADVYETKTQNGRIEIVHMNLVTSSEAVKEN